MKLHIFLTLTILLPSAFATKCVAPQPTTVERCLNPPVIPRLDIPAYTGRWFNTYVSGTATEFASDCVTANYTLNDDGSVGVQNCFFNEGQPRPLCLAGTATRRPGLPSSRLLVSFAPGSFGQYEVAALLGKRNYGYFAAAVYSCEVVDGVPKEGLFIIVRAPFAPAFVLRKLRERLVCKGYVLKDEFIMIKQPRTCRYYDGPDGFDPLPSFTRMPVS